MEPGLSVGERTWQIVDAATGGRFTATYACFLFATPAHEALRGRGATFMAGGAVTSSTTVVGWGLLVNERDGTMTLTADAAVDEDGTFCGHCWVEVPDWEPTVVDVMTGYVGTRVHRHASGARTAYAQTASLATSVKGHHAAAMAAVRKAVKGDAPYRELVADALGRYERLDAAQVR